MGRAADEAQLFLRQRLDLRIAKVLKAERVPKKDRLFKVELDLGPLGKREVVAGLGQLCPPEELVGRVVVFLANLKPAKIGGIVWLAIGLAVFLANRSRRGRSVSVIPAD